VGVTLEIRYCLSQYFLGVAGMPRRIPGAQIALIYNIIDDHFGENFTKSDMWKSNRSLAFLTIKFLRDKRKSRKGESFDQCTKISYDSLHVFSLCLCCFW
jgi:hypothetical protein